MEKNLLKNGKIILPNKLKIKFKLNVGIIGTGKISSEYVRIIKSYNHRVKYFFSITNNKNIYTLAKKNNAKILNSLNDVKNSKDVDFWIVCTSWKNLRKIFFKLLDISKPVLFEKSMIIDVKDLKKIRSNKNYKNIKKNFSFAYNRNYYDYMPKLMTILRKQKLIFGDACIFDPYKSINFSKGIGTKYLPIYITSHWVTFILKLFHLGNFNIRNKQLLILNKRRNYKKIKFELIKNKKIIFFELANLPNLPKNHQINFYFEDMIIKISPLEKIRLYKELHKKKINGLNVYKPKQEIFNVNQKFKPGFRFQYYDFVLSKFRKKKTLLSTNLDDLISTYEICDLLKK